MNTCDTCKWWDRDDPDKWSHVNGTKWDTTGFLTCSCKNPLFEVNEHEKSEFSVIQNGSDAGYVWLSTGPKFGCIHHKEIVKD